jgi:hypothetical protein
MSALGEIRDDDSKYNDIAKRLLPKKDEVMIHIDPMLKR